MDPTTPPLQLHRQPVTATFAPVPSAEAQADDPHDIIRRLNADLAEYPDTADDAASPAVLTEDAQLANMFRLATRLHDRIVEIQIPDPDDADKTAFVLRVHPLTDAQFEAIKRDKEVSEYVTTPIGVEMLTSTNEAKYRSLVIVNATTPEDTRRIWRNRDLLKSAGVATSLELVDMLLPAGFKESVYSKIESISGYRNPRARERILGE